MPISDPETPVRIHLLGSFEVRSGDRVLLAEDWPRRKAAALLKLLALDRRLLKDQAIDFLWPEADLTAGANNLYNTLHNLRKTIDKTLGQGASNAIFSFEDGILSLATTVWVDIQEFERLCTGPEPRAADLEQALALYRGDLLPDDRYEEWTLLPRQALYRRQRQARLEMVAYPREAREYAGALALLTPLLSHDPADEEAHRELMRLYTLAGQRHEALRQYQTCVDTLAEEIGAPPAPETTALYAQILSGELSPPPAPVQAPWSPPTPIVLAMKRSAPLVGRGAEPAGAGRICLSRERIRSCRLPGGHRTTAHRPRRGGRSANRAGSVDGCPPHPGAVGEKLKFRPN